MAATKCSFPFLLAAASLAYAQLHLPGAGNGDSTPKPKSKTAATAPTSAPAPPKPAFDYYLFALAWSHARFSVAGLLPLAAEGTSPESCEAKPVSKGVISLVLPVMPDKELIRREWEKHGSCTGLSAAAYFTDILRARSLVQIPVQLTSLDHSVTESPANIEEQFAGANPDFPAGAFRTGCDRGQLTEVHVCLDLSLKPRECPATALECSAPVISLQPIK